MGKKNKSEKIGAPPAPASPGECTQMASGSQVNVQTQVTASVSLQVLAQMLAGPSSRPTQGPEGLHSWHTKA